MNERIKELKNQTLDKHFSYTWSKMDYDDVTKFAEKFAELIIQECLLALEPDLYESDIEYKVDQAFYKKCERIIKKHFVVKE